LTEVLEALKFLERSAVELKPMKVGAIDGREAEDRTPLSTAVLTEIPSRIVEASDTGE
jgi:hypothetical protein